MEIKLNFDDDQIKIAELWLGDGQFAVWLEEIGKNKLRKRSDVYIRENTNYNPEKLSKVEKQNIIDSLKTNK